MWLQGISIVIFPFPSLLSFFFFFLWCVKPDSMRIIAQVSLENLFRNAGDFSITKNDTRQRIFALSRFHIEFLSIFSNIRNCTYKKIYCQLYLKC